MPVRDLANDYYDFDEKNFCLVGRRTGVRYRLGDKVKVKVARTSLEKKQLDFALVDDRQLRPDEDLMGRKVGVRQALAEKADRRRNRQKTRSRRSR